MRDLERLLEQARRELETRVAPTQRRATRAARRATRAARDAADRPLAEADRLRRRARVRRADHRSPPTTSSRRCRSRRGSAT